MGAYRSIGALHVISILWIFTIYLLIAYLSRHTGKNELYKFGANHRPMGITTGVKC